MKKNIKNLAIVFLMILSFSSCEDWLDVTTSAEINADDQFQTEQGFKDALIGAYIGMTAPELYARDMTYNIVDLLSQQYETLPTLAQFDQVQRYEYQNVFASNQIDNLWAKNYNVIANINAALGYMESKEDVLNPINYKLIKGELLGLRAFLHFDLMRLYNLGGLANRPNGDGKLAIPYVTKYTKNLTSQKSYSETFQLMEKDINESIDLLSIVDPIYQETSRPASYYDQVNRDGFFNKREQRMNYYAVKALQARVMIWQGTTDKLQTAQIAAEEVISKSQKMLINSGNYPITSDPILYPEILFALDVNALENINQRFLNGDGNTAYDALLISTSKADEVYETSNANIGIADIRYNTLLNSQTQGFISIKLKQENGLQNPNKIPLIKVPEMYYIAAESYIDSNLLKAIEYINKVRVSRGIIQNIPDTASKQDVEKELFKEYRKEFVGEGQLFFYYKRTARTSIPGLSQNTIVGDKIYVLPFPDSEIFFGGQ
jgi:hypothetical protein